MRHLSTLIGSFIAVVTIASGALGQQQLPSAMIHSLRPIDNVERTDLGALDLQAIRAEDTQNESLGMPLRFAIPHPVNITPDTHGTWEVIETGEMVWRHRITAINAQSINLGFARFQLPEHATLFLYTTDEARMIRPLIWEW